MAIQIKYPRWKDRSVGLADYRLGLIDTDVEILYRSKVSGEKLYPHLYTIKSVEARKCPKQRLSGGQTLYLVPISMLRIKQERLQKVKA